MNYRQANIVGGGKHSSLFLKIISLDNLLLSWREFKRGKATRRDIQQFAFNLEENIFCLHKELENMTYCHSPYQSFFIQDPKTRHIHKAGVKDRVVHQALFRVLYHYFDKKFIFDSYSCRLKKGNHKAVYRLDKLIRKASLDYQKPVFALKCDIRKFFANVDQKILLSLLQKTIKDQDTLWLVKKIIDSFTCSQNKGLPLGNVTSQLFSNIYLNELDYFVKHTLRQKFYIRYCDDFIILHQDKKYLENLVATLANFLQARLKLDLHPNKITIRKVNQGVDFLGYVALTRYRVLRTKTKKRILRLASSKNLQSYLGVLHHANAYELKQVLIKKIV
ncbi:MAG: reverse transcriptase/maturase family protein [Patescibacteria group bacterium]|nr:reverse transcriptase/maturase family protein [Patescibacteria group bacterium]